jgi:hypothetical protein
MHTYKLQTVCTQAGSAALQAVSASEQQLVEYKQRAQAALKKSSALASEFAAKNRALQDEAAELRLQSQADSDTAEVSTAAAQCSSQLLLAPLLLQACV